MGHKLSAVRFFTCKCKILMMDGEFGHSLVLLVGLGQPEVPREPHHKPALCQRLTFLNLPQIHKGSENPFAKTGKMWIGLEQLRQFGDAVRIYDAEEVKDGEERLIAARFIKLRQFL